MLAVKNKNEPACFNKTTDRLKQVFFGLDSQFYNNVVLRFGLQRHKNLLIRGRWWCGSTNTTGKCSQCLLKRSFCLHKHGCKSPRHLVKMILFDTANVLCLQKRHLSCAAFRKERASMFLFWWTCGQMFRLKTSQLFVSGSDESTLKSRRHDTRFCFVHFKVDCLTVQWLLRIYCQLSLCSLDKLGLF